MSMIGIIMLLALVRLKKWGIGRHLQVKGRFGLSPETAMGFYASVEPRVKSFQDHNLLELSTTRGDGGQPMLAMEVIEADEALRGQKKDVEATKPLPADAGRFVGVLLNILKYDLVGDVAAGRAEVAHGPEVPAPAALPEVRELALHLVR